MLSKLRCMKHQHQLLSPIYPRWEQTATETEFILNMKTPLAGRRKLFMLLARLKPDLEGYLDYTETGQGGEKRIDKRWEEFTTCMKREDGRKSLQGYTSRVGYLYTHLRRHDKKAYIEAYIQGHCSNYCPSLGLASRKLVCSD